MTQKEAIETFLFDFRRRRETPQREGSLIFESNPKRVEAEIRDLRSFLHYPFSTKNQPRRGFYKFTEIVLTDEWAHSIPHPDVSIRIPPTILDGGIQYQNGDMQIMIDNKTIALIDFTLRPDESIKSVEFNYHPTLQVPVIPQSPPNRTRSAFDREFEFPQYVRQLGKLLPKEGYHSFFGMNKRERKITKQEWREALLTKISQYLNKVDSSTFSDPETETHIIENLVILEEVLSA